MTSPTCASGFVERLRVHGRQRAGDGVLGCIKSLDRWNGGLLTSDPTLSFDSTYPLFPRTTSFSYARWDTRPVPRIFFETSASQFQGWSSIPGSITGALGSWFWISPFAFRVVVLRFRYLDWQPRCRPCAAPVMLPGIFDHFYACCPKPLLHGVNDDNRDWSSIPASITGALALGFKVSR